VRYAVCVTRQAAWLPFTVLPVACRTEFFGANLSVNDCGFVALHRQLSFRPPSFETTFLQLLTILFALTNILLPPPATLARAVYGPRTLRVT
jgi:hypothetical protein